MAVRCFLAVLFAGSLALAGSAKRFTLEQVMSAPFPSDLTAAKSSPRVAWVLDEQGKPAVHTPEFVTRRFDEELKRILHELPAGTTEESTERFTQARRLSEKMILTNAFNPS